VFSQSKNSVFLMESEYSLPCSQQLATSRYTEPDEYSRNSHTIFIKIHFNIIPHVRVGFSSNHFSSGVPTKIVCAFFPSLCVLRAPPILKALNCVQSSYWNLEFSQIK
jgi:hypothetical protein